MYMSVTSISLVSILFLNSSYVCDIALNEQKQNRKKKSRKKNEKNEKTCKWFPSIKSSISFLWSFSFLFATIQIFTCTMHTRTHGGNFFFPRMAHSSQFPLKTKIAFDISSNVGFNEHCNMVKSHFRRIGVSMSHFDLLNNVLMSVDILT